VEPGVSELELEPVIPELTEPPVLEEPPDESSGEETTTTDEEPSAESSRGRAPKRGAPMDMRSAEALLTFLLGASG
jgi:hypothetical protein